MNNVAGVDVAALRQRLEQMREQLDRSDVADEDATAPVDADQGRLSRAAAMEDQAISLELRQRRTVERQRIAAALKRLDEGEYGYCTNCGEAIARQRLELDPATPVCIECARRSEQTH